MYSLTLRFDPLSPIKSPFRIDNGSLECNVSEEEHSPSHEGTVLLDLLLGLDFLGGDYFQIDPQIVGVIDKTVSLKDSRTMLSISLQDIPSNPHFPAFQSSDLLPPSGNPNNHPSSPTSPLSKIR